MEGKTVVETACVMSQLMSSQDVNNSGNVHGGVVMRLIDTTGAIVAIRHARTNVVTASVDRLDFHYPAFMGDLLTFKASLNYVGRTSMEIGVRVEAENVRTGEVRHTASAYLTYVALGPNPHRPVTLPPLILETDEDERRNCDALARREVRLLERRQKEAGLAERAAKESKCS